MKKTLLYIGFSLISILPIRSQETKPVVGISDERPTACLLKNAMIQVDYAASPVKSDMLIRDGRIEAIGSAVESPAGTIIIDLEGKYIYPSFIDLDSEYGLADVNQAPSGRPSGRSGSRTQQFESSGKTPMNWNEAIHPQTSAAKLFTPDKTSAGAYRKAGFGTLLVHRHDGIARGTSSLVLLMDSPSQKSVIEDRVGNHYSFDKGSSKMSYPGSIMGSIALLRQSYMDAGWYGDLKSGEFQDVSLEAWNRNASYPSFIEVSDKKNLLRADRVGDEFGIQYIICGSGDEYQMLAEVKSTRAPLVIPLNYPTAPDVEDPYNAILVPLESLKHWEMAPANPASLQKAGVSFALTSKGLKSRDDFLKNLRKAVKYGLSEKEALKAITHTPAAMIGREREIGSLNPGFYANFLITSKSLFQDDCVIYENWVRGEKYVISDREIADLSGNWALEIAGMPALKMQVKGVPGKQTCEIIASDTLKEKGKLSVSGYNISLSFKDPSAADGEKFRLAGWTDMKDLKGTGESERGKQLTGMGESEQGKQLTWTARLTGEVEKSQNKSVIPGSPGEKPVTSDSKLGESEGTKTDQKVPVIGEVIYPFVAFGQTDLPGAEDLLFTNATVWTNEKEGILKEADVRVRNGKIAAVGNDLKPAGATVIDASGKHITSGIIDEHSHIAIDGGTNEATHAVTSEVRINDVVDHEDINIYRQLSGGTTTAHILHGSANPIGGQGAIIKHRWGASPETIKLEGQVIFLKHALGENVKQSRSESGTRYPRTRMGVEQVIRDAYTRTVEYQEKWDVYNSLDQKKKGLVASPRRDLQLEGISDLLGHRSFMTVHTYVQSETNMIMKLAEDFGITAHTLIHNTEGYKVADKMREHGAAGSIFSDWWAFKYEVYHAIPYNAALLLQNDVLTCIHSDNSELGRRLNQEAAKAVMYGGVSEEDALKLVTLNPAKILKIDHRCGSIKVGKDADLVLWSGHPLSVSSKPEKTLVDGIVYFDIEKDAQMQEWIRKERSRLIAKILNEKTTVSLAAGIRSNRQFEWDDEEVFDYFNDQEVIKDQQIINDR